MAEEIRNKFVSWRLRPKPYTTNQQDKRICGVGVKLAFGSSNNNNDNTNNHYNIVVDSVLADGPAAKAGLQEGDIIIEVDGRSFVNKKGIGNIPVTTPDDVANAIRGLADTTVVIVVERGDAGKEKLELTMTREPIGVLVVPPPSSQSFTPKEGRKEKDMTTAPSSPAAPYDEMPTVPMKTGASENIPDSSLELSINESSSERTLGHEGVVTADLTSSLSESADKFDNDAAPTIANATTTVVSRSRPSSALSRTTSLETKSVDEFDEDGTAESNSVNNDGGGGGGGSVVSESSQWEMLSERSGSAIVVSFSGSSYCGSTSLYNNRCPSPSMLKNKFILVESNGEPYLNHVVLPTDTLQGLCLAYKISATRLRMENGFSGNSLQLAPKKLRIPTVTSINNKTNNVGGGGASNGETPSSSSFAININHKGMMIRCQDQSSREYKLYAFVAEIETMELVEAKAYLDLANWDLEEALRSAREDMELEGWFEPNAKNKTTAAAASQIMMNAVAKPKTLTAWDIYTSTQPPFDGHGFELKDIKR
jgi:hypothetical protein